MPVASRDMRVMAEISVRSPESSVVFHTSICIKASHFFPVR